MFELHRKFTSSTDAPKHAKLESEALVSSPAGGEDTGPATQYLPLD